MGIEHQLALSAIDKRSMQAKKGGAENGRKTEGRRECGRSSQQCERESERERETLSHTTRQALASNNKATLVCFCVFPPVS